MASVVRPSASSVVTATGLSRYLSGAATDAPFLQALEEQIVLAEAETALLLGESTYDGSNWTARQAAVVALAVTFRTANLALNPVWLQFATGTQEPLLIGADEVETVKAYLLGRAQELEALVQSGTEEQDYALPSVSSGTFSVTSSDRTLVERNWLVDGSDGVSGWDTENG